MNVRNTVKGHSKMCMIWVPLLGFDSYIRGKLLPLQNEFILSIKWKKNFLQKSNKFWKIKKSNFHENGSTNLDG